MANALEELPGFHKPEQALDTICYGMFSLFLCYLAYRTAMRYVFLINNFPAP
jgi:hypothetical protein